MPQRTRSSVPRQPAEAADKSKRVCVNAPRAAAQASEREREEGGRGLFNPSNVNGQTKSERLGRAHETRVAIRQSEADGVRGSLLPFPSLSWLALPDSSVQTTMPSVLHPTNAFRDMDTIRQLVAGKQPVVFLDYDGTLSPIVDIPDRAFMTDAMRDALNALSSKFITAIVTGRSTEKVYNFVQLDNLVYAGSHGFDIKGPKSLPINCQVGDRFRPALEQCVRDLTDKLAGIPGAEIEDNRLAVSVHYRHVAPALQSVVEGIVDEYIACQPSLMKKHGKKVFELRPQVDWNKGRAVLYILSQLGLDADSIVPFYLGDDVSDEDAFSALNARGDGKGVSIIVRDPEASKVDLPGDSTELPATTAVYSLRDTLEVEQFLTTLTTLEEVVSF